MSDLQELRAVLYRETNNPSQYPTLIINAVLKEMFYRFGREEANRAIHELGLDKRGWSDR